MSGEHDFRNGFGTWKQRLSAIGTFKGVAFDGHERHHSLDYRDLSYLDEEAREDTDD